MILVNVPLNDKQLLEALKAVADPVRLKILRLLDKQGLCSIDRPAGLCARDVERHIKLSQPTISYHMAVLTKAGLVKAEKHGLWMWYRRDQKSLRMLAEAMSRQV